MKSASKIILGCSTIVGILLYFSSSAFATSSEFNIDVKPILSITIDDNSTSSPTATGQTSTSSLAVASTAMKFVTNNLTGFKVTISTDKESTEDNATSLVHLTAEDSIPTLTANKAKTSFPENYWGYSLDDVTYKPMVSKSDPMIVMNEDEPFSGTQNFYFAAKANSDKISGTYFATVLITAVANNVPMTLEESYASAGAKKVATAGGSYYAMQDMTPDICANAEVNETSMQVADIRDSKVYWIAKLADGHCWMTQNLDLDITEDGFDSTTTDIGYDSYMTDGTVKVWDSTSIYPPKKTIVYSDNSVNVHGYSDSWMSHMHNAAGSIDVGERYAIDGNGDWLNTYEGNDTHYAIGNFYQWEAAVAGSGSELTYEGDDKIASDSICPMGWRLVAYTGDYSAEDLYNEYIISSPLDILLPPVFTTMGWLKNIDGPSWEFISESYTDIYRLSNYLTTKALDTNQVYYLGGRIHSNVDGGLVRCIAR